MIDRYTKIVLTVIALSLTTLAIEQAAPRAYAQEQSCGLIQPCKVVWYYPMPVRVAQ
jgi:hypothetical protein